MEVESFIPVKQNGEITKENEFEVCIYVITKSKDVMLIVTLYVTIINETKS